MSAGGPLLRVTFRAAASTAIGAGHAARCVAVADALRAMGAQVRWACDRDAVPFLTERGVPQDEVCLLQGSATEGHAGERQADGGAQREDALRTLATGPADWFVVDAYALGAPWHAEVRASGARVAAFDDLADRALDVDLVVNAAAEDGAYRTLAPRAREACGLRAAIVGDPARPPAAGAGSLLLAFGAVDAANLTATTLAELAAAGMADRRIVVQLGMSAPHRAEVRQAMDALPDATFAPAVPTSPGSPVLAVGAAGVGLLERMHAGVPSVAVVASGNQRGLGSAAERAGAAVVAATPRQAVDAARGLLADPGTLARMSAAGRVAVDGRGAGRIAREMSRITGVDLRRARMEDARTLLDWRNHPEVRAASHGTEEIPWADHVRWLESSLARPDRHVLVAERSGRPVGTLRFDVAGDCATVSIAVDPTLRGAGLGPAMLDAGHAWLLRHDARVRRCRAEIRADNGPSVRAFRAAGYSGGPATYERPIGQGNQA